MSKRDGNTILIGSCKIYVTEFDGSTIPANSAIEIEGNRLGYVSGGATIDYTDTTYTAKDDLGYVKKTITTEEEVKIKFGLCTFDGAALAKLTATGRTSVSGGVRTTKIGGISNDNGKSYVWRLYHHDAVDGDVRYTVVGKNTAGFSIVHAKDSETVIEPEVTAEPSLDDDGTLLIIEEEVSSSSSSE